MLRKILKKIEKTLPFELRRPTSLLSIVAALAITGFFVKAGEFVFETLLKVFSPTLPFVRDFLSWVLTVSIRVNLVGLIIFILILFPIYRFVDKKLLKKKKGEVMFEDDFDKGNIGWFLNYWGSTEPEKTNRIENSYMIFEADEQVLTDARKEYGAYFDLNNGIYEGYSYEVSCFVKSTPSTSMQFQLWLHDTTGGGSVKFPHVSGIPTTSLMEIKTSFIATKTNALRIHLHNKAGQGSIMIDKVVVLKVGKIGKDI